MQGLSTGLLSNPVRERAKECEGASDSQLVLGRTPAAVLLTDGLIDALIDRCR